MFSTERLPFAATGFRLSLPSHLKVSPPALVAVMVLTPSSPDKVVRFFISMFSGLMLIAAGSDCLRSARSICPCSSRISSKMNRGGCSFFCCGGDPSEGGARLARLRLPSFSITAFTPNPSRLTWRKVQAHLNRLFISKSINNRLRRAMGRPSGSVMRKSFASKVKMYGLNRTSPICAFFLSFSWTTLGR